MKQRYYFRKLLCFCILAITIVSFSFAQDATTQGRDFWFAFMNNNSTDPTQTCLILSAEHACTVTVSNPNTGWSTSASIPAGGRIDLDIPLAQGYHSSTSDGGIYNVGCHLTATDVISAYTMNFRHASFDGGHLLPTSTLTDDYMVETIPPGLNGSSVLIVGTENGTMVDITPTAATNNGWAANTLHTITLNAGQVCQITTSAVNASFSGTRIQAHDCKKIAVFAGGKCAQAPSGCTYCDHIYEPMIPIVYWGTHFALTTSQTRSKDVVRITALNDGTIVTKNGAQVATLAAGGTYNFELTSSEGSCYIETSGPATCYLYVTGQSCGGGNGDPSMIYITPLEQNIQRIIFGTYQDASHTYSHYVNIVTHTANVGSVTLDGSNIGGQFTTLTGNPNYSFARVNISHASHTLQCDSGLVAHIYGLADVTSYGYNVGSTARDLSSSMSINGVNILDIPEDQLYCINREIDFSVNLNYQYDSIVWNFGDDRYGYTNPCTHIYDTNGQYQVMAIIMRNGYNNCFGTSYDTIYTTVTLPSLAPIPRYETVCGGGVYYFGGDTLTESGVYTDTLQTENSDCDSIIELHLTVVPADPIVINRLICHGDYYDLNGRHIYDPGDYFDTIATSAGCDSIIELHLQYAPDPTVNLGNNRTLCSMDQFPVVLTAPSNMNASLWSTGATTQSINAYQAGIYSVTVSNQNNCTASGEVGITLQDEITAVIETSGDFCEEGTATLTVTTNASNVQWSTGESTTEIVATHTGIYSVRAYEGICSGTASVELPQCPFDLYFPNCITPSFDDGMNDVFYLSNPDAVSEFEIFIYDRWGMLVFHSTDPHFKWDGKHKGKLSVNQVFTWKAIAAPRTEKKKREFNGSILVL